MTVLNDSNNNRTNYTVPRMRTVHEAAEELRRMDANTGVTEYHIRQLAINNIIPRVKAGKKYLINLDALIEYLSQPNPDRGGCR